MEINVVKRNLQKIFTNGQIFLGELKQDKDAIVVDNAMMLTAGNADRATLGKSLVRYVNRDASGKLKGLKFSANTEYTVQELNSTEVARYENEVNNFNTMVKTAIVEFVADMTTDKLRGGMDD